MYFQLGSPMMATARLDTSACKGETWHFQRNNGHSATTRQDRMTGHLQDLTHRARNQSRAEEACTESDEEQWLR